MSKRKGLAAFLAALLAFLLLSWGAGDLLRPVRREYGSMWPAYLREAPDSFDVLFFGSSLVYCDIAPAWIWEESGVRSYVMAGPEQTMPITYYYIREACRTQSPKTVMLEITGMFYAQYQNYTRANISYMPWSGNRLAATFAAAEPSLRFGLLFPLYDYHGRWTEVSPGELYHALVPAEDALAGYTLLTYACEAPAVCEREEFTADSETYRENLLWLEKIRDFCAKEGVALQLYIAPSAARIPAAALRTLQSDVSARGIALADFNDALPELGIDDGADWYDNLHFNVRGAEKFSRWLGGYLSQRPELARSGADAQRWSERLAALEGAARTRSEA